MTQHKQAAVDRGRQGLAFAVAGVGLLGLFAAHAAAALRVKVFTSDDVAYQTMVQAHQRR